MSGVLRPVLGNVWRLNLRAAPCEKSLLKMTATPRNQTKSLSTSRVKMAEQQGEIRDVHYPSDFQKKMLVWTKMYPNAEAIPEKVSLNTIRKARDIFRIRVNLFMIFGTVVGCGLMMYTGRKARREGDSISKRGMAWQKEMQEKGRQEREAAAEAKSRDQS